VSDEARAEPWPGADAVAELTVSGYSYVLDRENAERLRDDLDAAVSDRDSPEEASDCAESTVVDLYDLVEEFRGAANARIASPSDTYEARRETWHAAANKIEERLEVLEDDE